MSTLFAPYRRLRKLDQANADRLIDSISVFTWEDAIDLYQGFQWQDSAYTFVELAKTIQHDEKSAQCLLNAAIIYARVGEYRQAADVLDEVSSTDDVLALTLFLMGHVHYRLGNAERAEECLEISLDQLNGRIVDFRHAGLDFALDPSQVRDNLTTLYQSLDCYGEMGGLAPLSAVGLLDVPSRVSFFAKSIYSDRPVSTLDVVRPTECGPPQPKAPLPSPTMESFEYSKGEIKHHRLSAQPEGNDETTAPLMTRTYSNISGYQSNRGITTMVRRISSRKQQTMPGINQLSTAPPIMIEPVVQKPPVKQAPIEEECDDPFFFPVVRSRPMPKPRDPQARGKSATGFSRFLRRLPRLDSSQPPVVVKTSQRPVINHSPTSSTNSGSPPSLTDRESVSDDSTDSGSKSRAASMESVVVTIQNDAIPPVPKISHPLPLKNPHRRVLAMERAQEILAKRASTDASYLPAANAIPSLSQTYAKAAANLNPWTTPTAPAECPVDSDEESCYSNDDALAPIAIQPTPRQRSQSAYARPEEFPHHHALSSPQRPRRSDFEQPPMGSKKPLPRLPHHAYTYYHQMGTRQAGEMQSLEEILSPATLPISRYHTGRN